MVLNRFEQKGLHSTGKVDDHGPVLKVDRVVIRLYLCGAVFGTFQVAGEQTEAGHPDRVVELFLTFIQGSGRVGHEILPVINRRIICMCSSKDYCSGGSGGYGTRPVSDASSFMSGEDVIVSICSTRSNLKARLLQLSKKLPLNF